MTKSRTSVGTFRVDFIEGNKCFCFGFYSQLKAWEKYVEGVAKAYDEVLLFDFAGGRRNAILLASHSFRKGLKTYGKEIKASEADSAAQRQAAR